MAALDTGAVDGLAAILDRLGPNMWLVLDEVSLKRIFGTTGLAAVQAAPTLPNSTIALGRPATQEAPATIHTKSLSVARQFRRVDHQSCSSMMYLLEWVFSDPS